MANELDEMSGPVNGAGRDVNVIEKQLPVTVGWGSTLFEILLWVCGILPGLIFLFMKIGAKNYFRQLQQKLQADASTIDNYLEQRVQILQNVAGLVSKAVALDKDVMTALHPVIAQYKSMKYQPVIYRSGSADLKESTAALLCHTRRKMNSPTAAQ